MVCLGQDNAEAAIDDTTTYDEFMELLCSHVKNDVRKVYMERPSRDMNSLLSYDIQNWLCERLPRLTHYLKKLCSLGNSRKSLYLLMKLIEQIYNCCNQQLVVPLLLRDNFVTYKKLNSPMLSTLKASSTPSGLYTCLSSWLNNAASKPIEFSQGLVRVVFDNEQVIGKRYQIKGNQQSVPSSVITSNIYLAIGSDNFIQYDKEFKLSGWMFDTVTNSLTSGIENSFSE